jgi:KTSC domain-containing protein
MNVTVVESSTLATIAYQETRELLQLEFRSRVLYQYFRVPAAVYAGLLGAPSKGSYFNQEIRGRFPYRRIFHSQAKATGTKIPAGDRR